MVQRASSPTKITSLLLLIICGLHAPAGAVESDAGALKARVDALEQQLAARDNSTGISVGGAVRFQYAYRDYDDSSKDQVGTLEVDTVRFNLDGELGGMILSAEYRYYDYMQVIHHAWVGYAISPELTLRAGIFQVPFGNLPYNSNNFFFSSNYYLGLEDDYDLGVGAGYRGDDWHLDLALLKNDERAGSGSSDRYSYDVVGVRSGGEGIYDQPSQFVSESNTLVGRAARQFSRGAFSGELGGSLLYGNLYQVDADDGDYRAWAVHLNGDWHAWNIKLQVSDYRYTLAGNPERMVVGAYAFYDTIAAAATSLTAGIARSIDWQAGPVTGLTLYSDFSQVRDKRGGLADTWMNVTGLAISAGPVYTYVDVVTARNQPFIGGSMGAAEDGEINRRFNINVGYYF